MLYKTKYLQNCDSSLLTLTKTHFFSSTHYKKEIYKKKGESCILLQK